MGNVVSKIVVACQTTKCILGLRAIQPKAKELVSIGDETKGSMPNTTAVDSPAEHRVPKQRAKHVSFADSDLSISLITIPQSLEAELPRSLASTDAPSTEVCIFVAARSVEFFK